MPRWRNPPPAARWMPAAAGEISGAGGPRVYSAAPTGGTLTGNDPQKGER